MAHKLEIVGVTSRDGHLYVAMTCPDCPQANFGSTLEDHGDDHDADALVILKALASVQRLHDYDTREKR